MYRDKLISVAAASAMLVYTVSDAQAEQITAATALSCSGLTNAQLVSGSTITAAVTRDTTNAGWQSIITTNGTTFISNVRTDSFVGGVPLTLTYTLTGTPVNGLINVYDGAASLSITCPAAGPTSSPASTISQTISNAQAALINGAQTLQSYNDWVSKGVMGSFGLTGNGSSTAARRARQSEPTATARLERLRTEERELRDELAEHKDGDTVLSLRLQATRTDLMYARLASALESRPTLSTLRALPSSVPERERSSLTESQQARANISVPADGNIAEGPIGGASRPPQAAPAISLGTKDLNGFCDEECDVLGSKKWNVWLEGRATGAVDSLAQSNALGFIGSAGGDYKLQPWLALGLSVGVETFETKFGTAGVRSGTLGFTAMPYVGFRLSDNVFASAFLGVSTIAYNTTPLSNVSARFNALRLMFGGALTGVWRDGPWRFQPSLYATYGNEAQDSYTDSAGTTVASQVLTYGRIGAGPEVGYTLRPSDASWSVEPFVSIKGNLDFASSNSSVLNGQSVVLRPGTLGSGSTGLGVNVNLDNGVYLRAQGSYDSIGVLGLDVWSGLLRAGMTF
jgi:hypothetical protein